MEINKLIKGKPPSQTVVDVLKKDKGKPLFDTKAKEKK